MQRVDSHDSDISFDAPLDQVNIGDVSVHVGARLFDICRVFSLRSQRT